MSEIALEDLTREAFAPFGDVIDTGGLSFELRNDGTAKRFGQLAKIDVEADDGRTEISLFRSEGQAWPVRIGTIERHPLSSQLFMPLGVIPYVVVVARAGLEAPGPDDLHAFWAAKGQGVNYHKGVWHLPLTPIGDGGDFLVVEREGPGANCDLHSFAEDHRPVVLDPA